MFKKSETETIEVYVRAKGQPRYQSWPFDEATLIYTIRTNHVPRMHESIQLKRSIKGKTNFEVTTVGYRMSKNKSIPCILIDT